MGLSSSDAEKISSLKAKVRAIISMYAGIYTHIIKPLSSYYSLAHYQVYYRELYIESANCMKMLKKLKHNPTKDNCKELKEVMKSRHESSCDLFSICSRYYAHIYSLYISNPSYRPFLASRLSLLRSTTSEIHSKEKKIKRILFKKD